MRRLYDAALKLPSPIRTQTELARALDKTPQVVKNWESRKTGVSSEGATEAQARLGVSASWIKEGAGPMFVGEAASVGESQSAGLTRQMIATTVRLVDYVNDMVLDPIPQEDRGRLIDIATAEVMENWGHGITGDQDFAAAGRSIIKKLRTAKRG